MCIFLFLPLALIAAYVYLRGTRAITTREEWEQLHSGQHKHHLLP